MILHHGPDEDPRVLARILSRPTAVDLLRLDGALLDLADAHGVTPLLDHELHTAGFRAGLDPPVRARLARATHEAVAVDTVAREHNRRVLSALSGRGLEVLVFKGAALAETHYPATWLRPRGDLDLLVPTGQVAEASLVLERTGCCKVAKPEGRHVTSQARFEGMLGGVTVAYDLHWRLADPQAFADVIDHAALWSAAQPTVQPGIRMPCAVHALLIACVHRARHFDTDRLLLVYDIDRLSRRLSEAEWQGFSAEASARRVRAVSLRGLELAARLFQTPLPAGALAQLRQAVGETPIEAEPTAPFVAGMRREVDVLRSDLEQLPTWRSRAALLSEHLFPSRGYIAARYGAHHPLLAPGLVPLLYLHRIVTGLSRWFRPVR